MNHPILVTGLAEDRRLCPCGAVAQQSYDLWHECRAVMVWRQETGWTRSHAISSWTCARTGKAWIFTRLASLLHLVSGKAES
jgi:hypothetical protein